MSLERIVAMSVNYVAAEDRIRVDCQLASGLTSRFWLTRRIVQRLQQRLRVWLGRSSAVARSIEQPRVRETAMQMEHRNLQAAVVEQNRDAPSVRADLSPPGATAGVVTGVAFGETSSGRFGIAFILDGAKAPSLETRLDRAQLHWWAGRLDRLASQAAWNLPAEERGWLAKDVEPGPQSGPLH